MPSEKKCKAMECGLIIEFTINASELQGEWYDRNLSPKSE